MHKDSLEKTLKIVGAALDKKAYDLAVFEVEHLASIADYFLVMTGRSDVQVQGIARGIEELMARDGVKPLSIEGMEHGYWVLLDFNDVIVHIFFEPVREFYRLEHNWLDAQPVKLPEPYSSQVRDLSLRAIG